MSASRTKWQRVRGDRRCPVCGKSDWCVVASDGSAAICARVESPKDLGEAGWLHVLKDDDWKPCIVRNPEVQVKVDMQPLAKEYHRSLTEENAKALSESLGCSARSLRRLRAGWSAKWGAYSFPMRYPDGGICGIRYRGRSGAKFSERGSKNGLFFQPADIDGSYLVVVEGASDTAAAIDLGIRSVVGRASCRSNVDQIKTLVQSKSINRVVIIPDNDEPGIAGANALKLKLLSVTPDIAILELPSRFKDVRQARRANSAWLLEALSEWRLVR